MDHLRRRRLLVSSGALLACPLMLLGQPTERVRRIGFLHRVAEDSDFARFIHPVWVDSFRRFGWEVGRNLVIEWRYSAGRPELLDSLAQDLMRSNVEVILVANWVDAVLAAKRATRSIPIVGTGMTSPVELGLAESLAHPGGNVTGTANSNLEVSERQLQLLKEAVPWARRVAQLRGKAADSRSFVEAFERAASRLGLSIEWFFIAEPSDVTAALTRIASNKPDVLMVASNATVLERSREIAAFVRETRQLTIITSTELVELGVGVLGYNLSVRHVLERTVSYVDRILRGAKPADLPIEMPMKFELVVNAKLAQAIGYKVPQSILLQADRVIE